MFKRKYLFIFGLCLSLEATAAVYPMPSPGNDIVGEVTTVQAESGESLDAIGEHYGVGLHEMLEANPNLVESAQQLSAGEEVVIPTQFVLPKYRKGIVINLAECRLYYFSKDGRYVYTYPVGLGRKGWRTPLTSTTVIRKSSNPTWTPPATIKAFVYEQTGNKLPKSIGPEDPENPLGPYAMYLGKNGYLIHGTNQPWTVGKLNSAGCIRLSNNDVTELYQQVKTGTPVRIIHQPYKAGWQDGRLYLEAHKPVNLSELPSELNLMSVKCMPHSKTAQVNWEGLREIAEQQHGVPEEVK